jgi:hypothetical protein
LVSFTGKEQTMFSKISLYPLFLLLIILSLILAACQTPPTSPEPVVETLVVTEVVEATPMETIQVVTPTPELGGPRTLVICMGLEVDTLYPFIDSPRPKWAILEAIAEGGWAPSITTPSLTSQLSWKSCPAWQMGMLP